ncbi:MAG: SPFH domain-containing protein [Thermoplasmata archaeon]|nr:SPFH domain-containing protein [Thermoplasmata archaeon]MCI4344591.1 SPFH domain-containing protein [Thermoplasmata archaeon]
MVTNNPVPAKGGSLFGATTVAWEDVYKGSNVMWRVPRNIRYGDNIVVREDETAVFFRDGKVLAYLDKPGRYGLTSLNVGVLGNLIQSLTGVRQEAEVYYLQRRIFDGKFGSSEPYVFRDPDFGLVNLRLFGDYRWKVGTPDLFISQFVGTFGAAASSDVEARLRDQMVLLVYNTLGKLKDQGMRVTDLATQLTTIEQAVLGASASHFGPLGVEVQQLQGLSVNLPDDVQKAIDTRSSMGVLGVNYMQYQAGQALTQAASNPSGGAGSLVGAGVGLGAGLGMGAQMGGAMMGGGSAVPCPKCQTMVPSNVRFCPSCGTSMVPAAPAAAGPSTACPKCNASVPAGMKFCPNCGTSMAPQTRTCPKCQATVTGPSKFCPNCGQAMP